MALLVADKCMTGPSPRRTLTAEELGEWLRRVRDDRGLKRSELARLVGDRGVPLSYDYLNKLERGDRSLAQASLRVREALRAALNIGVERWEAETGLPAFELAAASDSAPTQPKPSDNVERVPFAFLPIRDLAHAGQPIDPDVVTTLDRFPLPLDQATPGVELYRAAGDSMTTADPDSIRDGDVLIVDTYDREPRDGQVYAVRLIGNGVTVKRVVVLGGQLWLFSDNPAHERFQVDEAIVIGRVRSWIRIVTPNKH